MSIKTASPGSVVAFEYTKANGEVSDRIVLVLTQPSDLFLTVDLTDVSETMLCEEIQLEYLEALEGVKRFQAKYAGMLKSFKKEGVSNVSRVA